jgi:hypothetical protein
MRHRAWASALAAGVVLCWAAAGRAETFRDAQRHFTVDLPAGWEPVPAYILAGINESSVQAGGPQADYFACFHIRGEPLAGHAYVLLLQPTSVRGATRTFATLERSLTEDLPGTVQRFEGRLADAAARLADGDALLDRAAKRFVMRGHTDMAGVGPITTLSVGMLGAGGTILVNCYAPAAEFDRHLPAFVALAESFRYDPGYEFSESGVLALLVHYATNGEIVTVVVLVAAAAAAVTLVKRRLRRPKAPADGPPPGGQKGAPPTAGRGAAAAPGKSKAARRRRRR